MNDARVSYALATVSLIAVGLLTRLPFIAWPESLGKYLGALIWGAMVYCIVRLIRPNVRVAASALMAITIAALIEFSQLWHPVWLDAFRRTTTGVLLLGRYFAMPDIAAYATGIALAAGLDLALKRRR